MIEKVEDKEDKEKEKKKKRMHFGKTFDFKDIFLIFFIVVMILFAGIYTITRPRLVSNLNCGRSIFDFDDSDDTECLKVVENTGLIPQIKMGLLNFADRIADWLLGFLIIIPVMVFILRLCYRWAGWDNQFMNRLLMFD